MFFWIDRMVSLGGKDMADAVKRQINYLLSPRMQESFNRTGRKDPRGSEENRKMAFSEHLEPLVKEAIRLLPFGMDVNPFLIENRITQLLKNAKKKRLSSSSQTVMGESMPKKRRLMTSDTDNDFLDTFIKRNGMLKIFVILIVLGVARVGNARSFAKFIKIPLTVVVQDSMTSSAVRPTEWYAAWPTNLRLIFLGHKEITYTMYCNVETLSKGSELQEITFCFDTKYNSKNCKKLTPDSSSAKMNIVAGVGPEVSLTFNPAAGGFARIDDVKAGLDISSYFSCMVKNKHGSVTSNRIDFIDLRRQFPSSLKSVPLPTQPIFKDGPTIFPCAVINVPADVTLSFSWGICPSGLFRFCDSPQTIRSTDTWPAQILKNGSLYFPYLTSEMASMMTGRNIYCSVEKIPAIYYTKELQISEKTPPTQVTSLTITHPPPANEVKVKLLNSKQTIATYYCNFEVGRGSYQVTWKKYPKGGGEPTILTFGANARFKVSVIQNHGIRFMGVFKAETEGKYICEVQWTPLSGAPQRKSAGYDVSLQYFPEVSKKLVPEIYVVSGKNGTFDCAFLKPFPEPKPTGNTVRPSLAINGFPIDLKSADSLQTSVTNINTKFSATLGQLTVDVNPINPQPGDSLRYTAIKMLNSHFINKKPMSHMVDCIGTNDVGSVRKSVLLKVVPDVELSVTPSDTNCTSCSAKQDHEFKCVIKNADVYNDTVSRVIVNQYWKVGNSIMSGSSGIIVISSDNTTLTVKKVDDEKMKDDLNKVGRITCVITMRYPPGMQEPDDLMVGPYMTKIFYNSEKDPALSKYLSTAIQLKDIAPAPKAASLSWAIALALSILVVLIVVILVFVWCRKRAPGETYDVDNTEKKQGNDPETENHEKEAFPVYERPEDGPIRGSRASLDDSIHVGSDDEDEDLAEYDVDIGKFNEEGSFIGQYAVNDGHSGGQPNNSRKLPNVSTNSAV